MPEIKEFGQSSKDILAWLETASRPALIAISGMTCSGKSTLAQELLKRLKDEAVLVSLDNFFRDLDDPLLPHDNQGKIIYDLPQSHDIPEFVAVINRLLGGYPAVLPFFDKPSCRRQKENYQTIAPKPIIITEGLFAIDFLKILKATILKVFVKAEPETCLRRRISRDQTIFQVTPEQIKKNFALKVLPYLPRLNRQEESSDFIVITD